MLWVVYTVHNGLQEVGRVRADHQPAAIKRAAAKWPEIADPHQSQFGFHVEPAS